MGKHFRTPAIKSGLTVKNREGDRMNFEKCKEKYFIIVEGEERAIIRSSPIAAEKKRKSMERYSNGKKISIFRAAEKN